MKEQLAAKLRPDHFSAMSGKMAAIVGYILEEDFSDPAILELVVTSDGRRGQVRDGQPPALGLEEPDIDPEVDGRMGESEFDHPTTIRRRSLRVLA